MIEHEHLQQCALITWASLSTKRYPELKWLFAVPNGGKRSKAVAGKMKASGVKSGVLDLNLPVRRGPFTSLWIEMKWAYGKMSPNQLEFKEFVEGQGAKVVTCWNWDDAKQAIVDYLEMGVS